MTALAAQANQDRQRIDARQNSSRIGIVAGAGALPVALAEAALARGLQPFIIGLAGNASSDIERFPHAYAGLGQIGRTLRTLRREGCQRIAFVGSLKRPNLFHLRPDAGFFRHLPELLRFFRGGDDAVLRRVARFFEAQGFEVVGVHEVAPRLLAPSGVFSRARPDAVAKEDIALAFRVARTLGALDIGQGVVVARHYVLAVEAAEGTDAMLTRCRDLNSWGFKSRQGVLVKMPKPGQDLRLDMPVVGPRTVELAAAAGLAGIAVAAGTVLLADQQELVEKADECGLFLYGASSAEVMGSE